MLGINIKLTLKESPIHHQNCIELKAKGATLIGDVGERKEDDGRGCFDECIDILDQAVKTISHSTIFDIPCV